MPEPKLRIRLRPVLRVPQEQLKGKAFCHAWAQTPAVVGELADDWAAGLRHRGSQYRLPRVIHRHELEERPDVVALSPWPMRNCTTDCLLVDAVPAQAPRSDDEVKST
jgi:hypothetical protein